MCTCMCPQGLSAHRPGLPDRRTSICLLSLLSSFLSFTFSLLFPLLSFLALDSYLLPVSLESLSPSYLSGGPMDPLNIWMEQQVQSSPEWKGSGPGLPCQPPESPAPTMLYSYIIDSHSRGLKGGRWEPGKSQDRGHIHCPTPLFLSPRQLPLCHRPDQPASRTLLPLHFSLCFLVFLSPAPPLPPGFSGFFLERNRPGHSSEGCGNESAATHEESSSALVMRRKENSSRELMRPPRTKEATSRGQRGGAQLSCPAEPQ